MSRSTHNDHFAEQLRGFGPVGIVAILVILLGNALFLPLSALLVLLWTRRSHTPWAEIGYRRPKSWALTAIGGIVFGIAFKVLMKSVVMPLFGAAPINPAYHYLAGNRAAVPGAIYLMSGDVRARRIRSHRARAHLLGSRDDGGAAYLQMKNRPIPITR